MTSRELDALPPELDQEFNSFIERWESGENPDPKEMLARYPAHRAVLERKLASFDFLKTALQSLTPDRASPRAGSQEWTVPTLTGFEMIRELGRGAFSGVFLARDQTLGRMVAIKILHPSLGEKALERFRREARALARVDHPSVPRVYSVHEGPDAPFMVMEYVEGRPLSAILEELRKRSVDTVELEVLGDAVGGRLQPFVKKHAVGLVPTGPAAMLSYFMAMGTCLADALEACHAAGVIHRDVKPSNLTIRPDGTPVLLDFGLAKREGESALTQTQEYVGTPFYSSPEQVRMSGEPTAAWDIYGLGMTLYECVTLDLPYGHRSPFLHRFKILPRRPTDLNAHVPRPLEDVVMRAIETDPERRYASAKDFAADLRAVIRGLPVRALSYRLARLRAMAMMRPSTLAAAVLVFALIGVSALLGKTLLARTYLVLGERAERAGDKESMVSYYTRALGQDRREVEAAHAILDYHEGAGDYENALGILAPYDDATLYQTGLWRRKVTLLFESGNKPAADAFVSTLYRSHGEDLDVLGWLAHLAMEREDWDALSLYAGRTLEIKSDDVGALNSLVLARFEEKRDTEAYKFLSRSLKVRPWQPDLFDLVGSQLVSRGVTYGRAAQVLAQAGATGEAISAIILLMTQYDTLLGTGRPCEGLALVLSRPADPSILEEARAASELYCGAGR